VPDNQPAVCPSYFALPDHTVVTLEGADAGAFAQAQFANDVLALAPGHWQWNTWLTAKGRVIALFALLKLAQDRLLLLLPDADETQFVADLQSYVFRRKVKVQVDVQLSVSGGFTRATTAKNARIDVAGDVIELDYGSALHPRSLRVAPSTQPIDAPGMRDQWKQLDLLHGLPRVPVGQRGLWTPHQLSLERLSAFSVKKGCYPGQEIVARTHFLGRAKRALALFEAEARMAQGADISDGPRVVGSIVCTSDADRHLGLAVMPLGHEIVALHADGLLLRALPLLAWPSVD